MPKGGCALFMGAYQADRSALGKGFRRQYGQVGCGGVLWALAGEPLARTCVCIISFDHYNRESLKEAGIVMVTNPSSIVFFGDSLSDPHNLFDAAAGLIEESVYLSLGGPNGQASDGPVYAEYVGGLAGFGATYNYAVGGGEAAGTQALLEFIQDNGYQSSLLVPLDDPRLAFDMNLGAQIDRFEADFAGQDLSDATGFILVGGNDYAAIDLGNPFSAVIEAFGTLATSVAATLSSAVDLASSGVGEVVIASLPVPGFFPTLAAQGDTIVGLVDILFDLHNSGLSEGVQFLTDLGLNVEMLDLQPITSAIIEDPTGFGLIAPLDLTLRGGDPGLLADFDADQVAFWDSIHPSGATHAIIGAYTAEALDALPITLSELDDEIQTGSADDLVLALAGNDGIDAGAGNDTILGGSGDDGIIAGIGDDLVLAGSGNDWVQAGDGADVIQAGQGDDVVLAGDGADVIFDGLGSDTIVGGAGDDIFVFVQAELIGGTTGVDEDVFLGDSGQDSLIVAVASETMILLNALASDAARLDALGIVAGDIESVEFVVGREGLSTLSGNGWYESADLWGVL